MPKPIKERKTDNVLGQKINSLMRERGIAGDYALLAKIFAVKTPSVYDWIDHGRLGKERYAMLVEWSGRSLDWWFDIVRPADHLYSRSTQAAHPVREADAIVELAPKAQQISPFPRISVSDWQALPSEVVHEIETYALGLIAGRGLQQSQKRKNGTTD